MTDEEKRFVDLMLSPKGLKAAEELMAQSVVKLDDVLQGETSTRAEYFYDPCPVCKGECLGHWMTKP